MRILVRRALAFCATHDRVGKWVLAQTFHRGYETKQRGFVEAFAWLDAYQFGASERQRPGLVDHDRIDLLKRLQRFSILDQDAVGRALARADHDRHRGCQT